MNTKMTNAKIYLNSTDANFAPKYQHKICSCHEADIMIMILSTIYYDRTVLIAQS